MFFGGKEAKLKTSSYENGTLLSRVPLFRMAIGCGKQDLLMSVA